MKSLLRRISSALASGRGVAADSVPAGALVNAGTTTGQTDRDGSVAIRSGHVHVVEPTGAGRWPVIAPGARVQVWVDGQPIAGPTILQAEQGIRLETPALPHMREADVAIAEDQMSACLHLGPGVVSGWQIVDTLPSPVVSPQVEACQVNLPGPDAVAVRALLARQGVTHGIDDAAIARALAAPAPSITLVAQGTPPVAPDPGRVTLRLPPAEAGRPATVEPGTVLALCNQPHPGVPGYDVLGTTLLPPEATPTRLVLGRGVGMSPSGVQVLALATGVPEAATSDDGTVQLAVQPLLVHRGNLGHGHGPVEFDGDVLIDGWAELGCVVRTSGSIFISGGAQGVELAAGNEVHVASGCIRGIIRQGEARSLSRRLQGDIQELSRLLTELRHTVHMALNHPRYSQVAGRGGVGPLVLLLVQNRFGRLVELHRRLTARASQDVAIPKELQLLVEAVGQVATGGVAGEEDLVATCHTVSDWIDRQQQDARDSAGRVLVYHLLYSQVFAAGAVEVSGPGAEHSDIVAGGAVLVTGQVRGGRIQSESGVQVGRVGAPVGMQTVLAVPAEGEIRIEHAYPGTVCEVGARSLRLDHEVRYVTIRLNDQEQVTLYHD